MGRVWAGLPGVFLFDILDCAAAFDGSYSETGRVTEAGHDAGLPLQRGGDSLVDLGRVLEVDHVDVAFSSCDNEELVLDVHAVHALPCVQRTDRLSALQVPELDRLVPGARRDVVVAAGLEPAHAFDAFGVRLCLLRRDLAACGCGSEVDDVKVAGRVAGGDARAIL
jgi:hypothetical protein